MKSKPQPHIALTRTEALFLLKSDKDGKSFSDKNEITIMCKSPDNKNDWRSSTSDDYYSILENATTYKNFEIWLSEGQSKAGTQHLINKLNIPQECLLTIAVLCHSSTDVDLITTEIADDKEMIEDFLSYHCQYDLENISWMTGETVKLNYLTEKSFEK